MQTAEDLKGGSRGKSLLRVGAAGAKAKQWECVWGVCLASCRSCETSGGGEGNDGGDQVTV